MKRNYWPWLFVGLFSTGFVLIIWTIVSAVNTPVHEDRTFLAKYQQIDDSFNDILDSNVAFREKYDFTIAINEKVFDLTTEDIFYSQRVLEEKSPHKNLLRKGDNKISIALKDKAGNDITDAMVKFRVTKATNSKSDMDFEQYDVNVNIPIQGNWNITGTIETTNGDKGYFYIKTNAI